MIQKILCYFGYHEPILSMEFACLHKQCKYCGTLIEMIADTDQLVELGLIELESSNHA